MKGLLHQVTQTNNLELPSFGEVEHSNAEQPYNPTLEIQNNIKLFFDLVMDLPKCSHAEARRKFWLKYARGGMIVQTWCTLTPELGKRAKSKFPEFPEFGTLKKNRRVDVHHGVLLMRFPQFQVAEWSHLGKCRFWHMNNPNKPEFFDMNHTRDDLLNYPDYVQQHYFSKLGRWQRDAARWIEEHL